MLLRPEVRAAIGTAWVTTVNRRPRGSSAAKPARVVPASSRIVARRRRAAARGPRWRSRPSRAWRAVPLGDRRLDHAERVGGDDATVHPPDDARTFEYGEVATDRLGGHVELVGDLGDREPAATGDGGAMACWRSSAYISTSCSSSSLVCVVLPLNVLTVKELAVLNVTMATSSTDSLAGTPVVPGLALGPVLRARTEVDPAAVGAVRRAGDAGPPWRRTTPRSEAVVAGSPTGRRAHGAAAEVLAASGALAKDKGLRRPGPKNSTAVGLFAAVEQRSSSSRTCSPRWAG